MFKIKIGNKYGGRYIEIVISEAEDAKTIMSILAKNGIPCILYGAHEEKGAK